MNDPKCSRSVDIVEHFLLKGNVLMMIEEIAVLYCSYFKGYSGTSAVGAALLLDNYQYSTR